MPAVLVTGASGTIDPALSASYTTAANRASARPCGKAVVVLGSDVDIVVGDFGSPASMQVALKGVDRVFLACPNYPTPGRVRDERHQSHRPRQHRSTRQAVGERCLAGSPLDFWD